MLGFFLQSLLLVWLLLDLAAARTTEQGAIDPPSDDSEFEVVRIAGPFAFPWSLAFLPDHSILLTERAGRLWLVRPSSGAREVTGLPAILSESHAGLLDVAIDPHFSKNGIVYLSYVHGTKELSTVRVLRAKLNRSVKRLFDTRVIFESNSAASREQIGGRMAISRDGYLFLTLGDRWEAERAQDRSDHAGSIVRIRTDGSVPEDNPFVSVPGARPEIWSYGHRNPQGLAFDLRTGQLWSHEHGPLGGDELNLIIAGRNYGWPVITHGRDYSGKPIGEGTAKAGMEAPVHHWMSSIAPSGLAIANAGPVAVFWIGALAGEALVRIDMENERIIREEHKLNGAIGRIRDVRIGPDGFLYVVSDHPEGALYRLDPVREQAVDDRKKGRI